MTEPGTMPVAVHAEVLARCPFGCNERDSNGELAVVLICQRDVRDNYDIGYTVRCNECGVEVHKEYQHEVVAHWNRRASEAELVAMLRDMTGLFQMALLCTSESIAKDGMVEVRKARALLARYPQAR